MLNETITQSHILLPGVEQTFGTLIAPHELCEIVVDPNGQLQAGNSQWRLYDVTPAGAALIWHGALTPPFEGPQRLTPVGGVAAGSTVELRAFNVNALPTAGNVTATLVGYDPNCCGDAGNCCLTVPDLASLAELDDTLGGAMCFDVQVESLGCATFLLDRTSTATIDGITVVGTSSGTGRWLRTDADTPKWKYQTVWYQSDATGNDENDGAAAIPAPGFVGPVKTLAEIYRRFGQYPLLPGTFVPPAPGPIPGHTETTIYILDDTSPSDPVRMHVTLPGKGLLVFVGVATTIRSGTVTAFQVLNPATNDAWEITDGVIDWTADVGFRIRITNNVNGNLNQIYWVAKPIVLGTARVSGPNSFGDPSVPGSVLIRNPVLSGTVAVGDTYVIESLPKLYWSDVDVRGPIAGAPAATYGFSNLAFSPVPGPGPQVLVNCAKTSPNFLGCSFYGVEFDAIGAVNYSMKNCAFSAMSADLSYLVLQGGLCLTKGPFVGLIICRPGGAITIRNDFLFQGVAAGPLPQGIFAAGGHIRIEDAGAFDSSLAGVTIGGTPFDGGGPGGGVFVNSSLYGSGNGGSGTGAGVDVMPGATLAYASLPTIVGAAGSNFTLGLNSATGRPFDNATGAYTAATVANLWTNLPLAIGLGFAGGAHDPQSDSHVIAE